jgi:transcriptional regulator with XRE-family HTH domain
MTDYDRDLADLIDPELVQAWSDEVVRLRKEAGLNQQQMADLLGIARPNMARMEKGRHMPFVYIVVRTAMACGADPVEVFQRMYGAARGRAEAILKAHRSKKEQP